MRYFIVTLISNNNGNTFYTTLDVSSSVYVNRIDLIKHQKEIYGKDLECVIVNIIELTEADYINHTKCN